MVFVLNNEQPLQFEDQRVIDLLNCALEGGSNYWIQSHQKNYPPGKGYASYEFAYLEVPFDEGGSISFFTGDKGIDGLEGKLLNRASMEDGLRLMAEKYPKHWADFIGENEDADTGDVFLQLALFGEVVFG